MLRGALTRQAEPRLVQVAHRLGGGGCLLLLLLLGGGRLHRRHRGHGLGGEGDLAHGPVVQPPGHGTELCQLEDATQTRGGEGRGGRQYDWSNVLRIQDMSYLWGSLQPSTHPVVIISLFRVWRRRSTLLTRVGSPPSTPPPPHYFIIARRVSIRELHTKYSRVEMKCTAIQFTLWPSMPFIIYPLAVLFSLSEE